VEVQLHTKSKEKLSLCLIKYQTIKVYGEMKMQPPAFLTLTLNEYEWKELKIYMYKFI